MNLLKLLALESESDDYHENPKLKSSKKNLTKINIKPNQYVCLSFFICIRWQLVKIKDFKYLFFQKWNKIIYNKLYYGLVDFADFNGIRAIQPEECTCSRHATFRS